MRPLIEAFLSEQLLVETTEGVVAHLARCPACRAEVESIGRLRAATQSAFARSRELDARPEFLAALTDRLQAQAATRPAAMSRRTWLSLAAGLLAAVGGGAMWRRWSRSHVDALAAAAVGDHRFCALDFKLAESPISLDEAARRFGGANHALETLEPSPRVLADGGVTVLERHSCVYAGQRFAHIVLLYKDRPVSLLITDAGDPSLPVWGIAAEDGDGVARLGARDGFQVAAFDEAGHIAFLVSALDDDDLRDVAGAVHGPVARALDRI